MPTASPSPIRFRPATLADAHALRLLAIQVFLDTYAPEGIHNDIAREADITFALENFHQWLQARDEQILVAEADTGLVGLAHLARRTHAGNPQAGEVELQRLYLRKNFIGQGVGRSLLQRAEAAAAREGARALWLTVWTPNAHARAFYERQGYEDLGPAEYVFEDQVFENRLMSRPLP